MELLRGSARVSQEESEESDLRALVLIVGLLAVSLYFTDLEAASVLQGVLLPLLDFILLCALALWLAARSGWQKIDRPGSNSGFLGGLFGGDDSGGGCD